MLKIGSGTARDLGTKFWEINDPLGALLSEFNHARFPTILDGAPVYYLDLDLDKLCENVQPAHDVDGFVQVATHAAGLDTAADAGLRRYIMAALLNALGRQGNARQAYLGLLYSKMAAVAAGAAQQGTPVTLAVLQAHAIVG